MSLPQSQISRQGKASHNEELDVIKDAWVPPLIMRRAGKSSLGANESLWVSTDGADIQVGDRFYKGPILNEVIDIFVIPYPNKDRGYGPTGATTQEHMPDPDGEAANGYGTAVVVRALPPPRQTPLDGTNEVQIEGLE